MRDSREFDARTDRTRRVFGERHEPLVLPPAIPLARTCVRDAHAPLARRAFDERTPEQRAKDDLGLRVVGHETPADSRGMLSHSGMSGGALTRCCRPTVRR